MVSGTISDQNLSLAQRPPLMTHVFTACHRNSCALRALELQIAPPGIRGGRPYREKQGGAPGPLRPAGREPRAMFWWI